ncbi:WGxxGxxG-CTERM domain-containing protein [Nostoc sp. XA010]|uniref:WGxxGxxG family protein n=1 Tax=Nostoc sp. XA010 TaxID=2780407 RepID=UPI001E2C2E53|nr:WGxxGxxG family protein [Nostoc sp. XA010]MCC5661597.1 WGxxGxxG-CTERM domain-containing protein [Nostoc sp. XA010]
MKRSDISKVIGSSILAVGLAVTPLIMPASAQSNTSGDTNTTSRTDNTSTQGANSRDDNGFDWGWLGLLGLAGLAGLAKGKRSESTAYRDPNAVR